MDSDQEFLSSSGGQSEEETDHFFDPIVPNSRIKLSYHVDHKSISLKEMSKRLDQHASSVSEILGISIPDSKLLLIMYRWDKDYLIDKYTQGITYSLENKIVKYKKPTSCDICCSDDVVEVFMADCGHPFCIDCYKQYITQKIRESEVLIKCPGECSVFIGIDKLDKILSTSVFEMMQVQIVKKFVDDQKFLKWCTYPDCDQVIECHITQDALETRVPSVECQNGHRFCFGCSNADHLPATCSTAKLWLKKCSDDSETANWINANTKECTKCNSTIEKNGGCNHMTCRKCKYEFCWICMGPWAQHGQSWYNCNRFEESESVQARDAQSKSRAALDRYLHYYNRYANHGQSARLDKELYERTEKKMEDMQHKSEFSWIQVQFLANTVKVLLKARQTLMWTYGFAYYLERNNNYTTIFEDNQKDLEMAVEALSGLLETNITSENAASLRQQVLDKTEYVNRRREVLLADTAQGHIDKRWVYTKEQPAAFITPP